MTTTVEVLRQARSLIDTPDKWCQHHEALTVGLMPVGGSDEFAIQRCPIGALIQASVNSRSLEGPLGNIHPALDLVIDQVPGMAGYAGRLQHYNDHHDTTHEDIMQLFDKAIKIAEAS